MLLLAWTTALETGIPELDEDHKQVVALANIIAEGIARGEVVGLARDTLHAWNYIAGHFDREERFMRDIHYPGYETHRKEHEDIFAKMTLAFLTTPDDRKTFDEIAPVILSWVSSHLSEAEQSLAAWVRDRKTAAAA